MPASNRFVSIPKFVHIDTTLGLFHMAEDTKLYLSILNEFYKTYVNFNINTLNQKDFKIVIHTLKGVTSNIGASSLYDITVKLEKQRDASLCSLFHTELEKVLTELEVLKQEDTPKTVLVDDEKKEELFEALKEAIEEEIPKKCIDILDDLKQYQCTFLEKEMLYAITLALAEFDFDDALEIIGRL